MLTIDIDQDGIALVTIDMPGRSMNVIDWPMLDALDAAARRLVADAAVTGIVFTSGKGAFIAGADLAIMEDLSGPGLTAGETAQRAGRMGDVFRRIETCGKPVVAAAPGTALGGGFELMLACHHRIAADTPKAVFGLPEVKLGLLPGAGGTQRLPRLIGIAEALPLLLEGRALTVAEAQAAGLLDAVVPPEALLDTAKAALREQRVSPEPAWDQKGFGWPGAAPASPAVQELFALVNARTLAATRGLYPAPQAILSCVFEGARLPMDKALKVERDYFATLVRGKCPGRSSAPSSSPGRPATRPGGGPGIRGMRWSARGARPMWRKAFAW
ncbi:enoyl-CoA hydratase/isomerase family protein [Xanthobacter dioxanivorans]|uniref:Enoyl-CoA hydratase/isomerase family protein n=1 Tax=Xanthobacter dioxanivorans TaxID=2528964 RepID=A0A974PQB5_9HYPH|nr:enoyl-CoA hydratase-related protein [Xanthobacter dioxanivorans]QRG07787.1 enoyl-CoA hydratase/isomerase family protein [Xanthobacter dioxanivorans]